MEGGVLVLLAGIGVGIEEGGGEVEQGVLLGEVEVVHCSRVGVRRARNIPGVRLEVRVIGSAAMGRRRVWWQRAELGTLCDPACAWVWVSR